MTDILKKIVDVKRAEVERLKSELSQAQLENHIEKQSPPLNLAGALTGNRVRVIGEIKRSSPVKGVLRKNLDPCLLARTYADNGAAAISVLTNVDHFHGCLEDMVVVRDSMFPRGIPVIRKDFIFDQYQVYESRANGADAILLIVSILTEKTLRQLINLSESFWMQCLVEVHNENEIKIALAAGAEIIGINNRNLKTFETDLNTTERLTPLVPSGHVVVSESGISEPADINRVGKAGAHAVLVGESLVSSTDPGAKMRELV